MIDFSPCSHDVFASLLNKLVYVLDSLMDGRYKSGNCVTITDLEIAQVKIVRTIRVWILWKF